MGMTERDRKLLAIFACVVFLGGYWFLVLGKKRAAVGEAETAKSSAQAALSDAVAAESAGAAEKKKYPVKYSQVLKMGKAIPVDSDFASLLVQVSDISDDSGVEFTSLTSAQGAPASAAAPGAGPTGTTTCEAKISTDGASASTGASPATGATGAVVQPSAAVSAVGTAANAADAGAATADKDADRASKSDADFAAKCATSPTLTDVTAQASGLSLYSYSFTFNGSFYNLHDVFNGLTGMVRANNGKIKVTGRLLQINSFTMAVKEFPILEAKVEMTGYSLPVGTTITAGATASGPAGSVDAAAVSASPTAPTAAPPASIILGGR